MPKGNLVIEVQQNGVVVGSGPIRSATNWRYTGRMDRAGAFSFAMPAEDAKADLIVRKATVHAYAYMDGLRQEIGAGVVDSIRYGVGQNDQVMMTAGGACLLHELNYRSVGRLKLGDGGTPLSHAAAIAAIAAFAPDGWTFYPALTPEDDLIYGQFGGESVLGALVWIAEKSRVHFYRGPGRTVFFTSQFAPSGIRAVRAVHARSAETCVILGIEREEDSFDYANRIYPLGGGDGEEAVTLEVTSRTAPTGYTLNKPGNYIEHNDGVALHDVIEEWVEYKSIGVLSNTDADVVEAANALFDVTLADLRRRASETRESYRLQVADCARLLRPTENIRAVYRNTRARLDIDADLNILEASLAMDADELRTTDLLVSTEDVWPENDDVATAKQMRQGKVFRAIPQTSGTPYEVAHVQNLDEQSASSTDYHARFPFSLDDHVTQVNQIKFRYTLRDLESTVRTVAGTNSTSDQDLTLTSGGGGSVTTLPVSGASVPDTGPPTGIYGARTSSDSPADPHDHATPHIHSLVHNHTLTLSEHQHPMVHQHTVTPLITMQHGVYRAPVGERFLYTDLEYRVNGGTWAALPASPVDITDQVSGAVVAFRPNQVDNLIEMRRKASVDGGFGTRKSCRIELLLQVRIRSQSIRYD